MTLRCPIGFVGKFPAHNEFVHLRSSGEPFASFDTWLTENIEWAAARVGDEWAGSYGAGGIHAFVFRSGGADPQQPFVVGALGPSFDGAGRRFPAAVVAALTPASAVQRAPAALPILLEDFWHVASSLVVEASVLSVSDLDQRLLRESPQASDDPSDALSDYGDWMGSLSLGELWALVFDDPSAGDATPRLRWLIEAIRPYRGIERPRTPLTLRLPLGRAGGASVCFWIDLVGRLARWRSTIPSFFWSHDGAAGNMLLHLGDPPRTTLAELWSPASARDEICDLSRTIRPEELAACHPPPAALSALSSNLDAPALSLLSWASE